MAGLSQLYQRPLHLEVCFSVKRHCLRRPVNNAFLHLLAGSLRTSIYAAPPRPSACNNARSAGIGSFRLRSSTSPTLTSCHLTDFHRVLSWLLDCHSRSKTSVSLLFSSLSRRHRRMS